MLLDTIGMTKELRAEAQQVLFLHDLVDSYGHLTTKGTFVSNLDCETEYGCLLWMANEHKVLSEAITIFTILSRNPTFVSNEFKKLLPHPDGDLHNMLNAWNAAMWIQQFTRNWETEPATRVWGKYNLSQRQFEVLQEYREFVVERCSKQFAIPTEQLQINPSTDKNAMSRLSLALFRAFKTSLLVRDVDGHYSMINDQDQWQIATTSTVKFAPSLVIAPGRTVRILGHQSKSEEPPVAKLEIVMGVPEEFLLSELWYCQNHQRNPWFADLVEILLIQPVYSHMAGVERICPALGLTSIPACDLLDIGSIHDVGSFDLYFAPTQWLYARGADQIQDRCVKKRTDFPLESVRMPDVRKEIPQVLYEVTYMTFPSASWESKAKKAARKGGSFTTFGKHVVMPCTGNPQHGDIPDGWKAIMEDLVPDAHIPYKVRMGLVTEISKPTVNDQVPEVRDSHEAAQNQAEEGAEEKDNKRIQVIPIASSSFSFNAMESEFDPETGQYSGNPLKLRCQICGPTKKDVHVAHYDADSMYAPANHMQKIHGVVVCPSTKRYTDQQLVAGRAIQASFSWLNRERDDIGTHKERKLMRSGPSFKDAISPVALAELPLDLNQQAALLPLTFVAQYDEIYVRPEHPITSKSMTKNGKTKDCNFRKINSRRKNL